MFPSREKGESLYRRKLTRSNCTCITAIVRIKKGPFPKNTQFLYLRLIALHQDDDAVCSTHGEDGGRCKHCRNYLSAWIVKAAFIMRTNLVQGHCEQYVRNVSREAIRDIVVGCFEFID